MSVCKHVYLFSQTPRKDHGGKQNVGVAFARAHQIDVTTNNPPRKIQIDPRNQGIRALLRGLDLLGEGDKSERRMFVFSSRPVFANAK